MFDFIGKRNIFFVISLIVILAGIIATMINGPQFGIDFTGGTVIQINIGKEFNNSDIYDILNKYNVGKDSFVQQAGDYKHEVIIKTVDMPDSERQNIINDILKKYDLKTDAILAVNNVGPTIGSELRRNALMAVVIASVAMLIYIAIRFEYKFGVAAIVALIHDLLVTYAVYALFKIPINSSFVAAMLTILGYSINDTIVIFDRIRENLKNGKRKMGLEELINTSITQTMTRSINTALTTLVTITILYFIGPSSIKEFALPLIVGITSGAYSSIFIASPIWYLWKRTEKGVKSTAKSGLRTT
ncbi:MAG: protein translocase subunit SecF [Thermoanaerobacteraceae bacterium]|nr:protein translocase subunit SecF [Thermoanaerobacteraceae bacterium]